MRVRPTGKPHVKPRLGLAYLSACSSACDLSTDTAHRSLHLANCLQLAGFENVIGTLWDSYGDTCSEIASKFYDFLFSKNVSPAGGTPGSVLGYATCVGG